MGILKKLKILHLGLLVFLLSNFLMGLIFGFKLNSYLIFGFKIIFYLSAIVLFFMTIKPFEWLGLYFSIYVISPFGVLLSWLADGIFGAIIGSFFLFLLSPPIFAASNKDYFIKENSTGFMARCCNYSIYERNFWIFENKLLDFEFDEPNISKFEIIKKTAKITFKRTEESMLDTTIIVKIR
jgi:hypothetical protein